MGDGVLTEPRRAHHCPQFASIRITQLMRAQHRLYEYMRNKNNKKNWEKSHYMWQRHSRDDRQICIKLGWSRDLINWINYFEFCIDRSTEGFLFFRGPTLIALDLTMQFSVHRTRAALWNIHRDSIFLYWLYCSPVDHLITLVLSTS